MSEQPKWWLDDAFTLHPPLMRHRFDGDPWGPCSQCSHPVYHEIHRVDDDPPTPKDAA